MQRLSVGRGGPRDLAALRDGLRAGAELALVLRAASAGGNALAPPPAQLATLAEALSGHDELVTLYAAALADELPLLARDGGFVRAGWRTELDEQRSLRDDGRRMVAALEAKYRTATGVASLKIRHNNVLGYHIEITAASLRGFDPRQHDFIHRQSMANAMRFSTGELAELESKIVHAGDRALALELKMFEDLVGETIARQVDFALVGPRALIWLPSASTVSWTMSCPAADFAALIS